MDERVDTAKSTTCLAVEAASSQTKTEMKYTLVISNGQDGFLIGQIKELPEVFTQGLTVAELKENIADALEMYFEDMRENL